MPRHHHLLTIVLHWLTLILVMFGLAAVLSRGLTDDRALRLTLLNMHRSAGLLILVTVSLRLLTRWPLAAHRVNSDLPAVLHLASRLGHAALYLGLLGIPMLGWALSSARGQSVQLLGLLPLPALLERNRDLAETLESWHENVAWVLIALASIHAIAALWHHYFRKDDVLRSMLPKAPVDLSTHSIKP